ncbi:MAG: hypothetical protein WBB01_13605 [Phormidesmis sp.]
MGTCIGRLLFSNPDSLPFDKTNLAKIPLSLPTYSDGSQSLDKPILKGFESNEAGLSQAHPGVLFSNFSEKTKKSLDVKEEND